MKKDKNTSMGVDDKNTSMGIDADQVSAVSQNMLANEAFENMADPMDSLPSSMDA